MRHGSIFFLWWIICFLLVLFSWNSSRQVTFSSFITEFSQLKLSNGWGTMIDDLRRLSLQIETAFKDNWLSISVSTPTSNLDLFGWLKYIGQSIAGIIYFFVQMIGPAFQILFSFLHFFFDILSDLIQILVFVFGFLFGSA